MAAWVSTRRSAWASGSLVYIVPVMSVGHIDANSICDANKCRSHNLNLAASRDRNDLPQGQPAQLPTHFINNDFSVQASLHHRYPAAGFWRRVVSARNWVRGEFYTCSSPATNPGWPVGTPHQLNKSL